jgi:hypothetical protein
MEEFLIQNSLHKILDVMNYASLAASTTKLKMTPQINISGTGNCGNPSRGELEAMICTV